jgi:hypothetical protein
MAAAWQDRPWRNRMAKTDRMWEVFKAGVDLGKRYGSESVPPNVLVKEFEEVNADLKQGAGPDPDQLRIPD